MLHSVFFLTSYMFLTYFFLAALLFGNFKD